MWLARLWEALGRVPATARRTPTPAPWKARLQLTVDRLEDRTVPANFTAADVPELIAAIEAANQTPEADTIALVAGTTFTLTEVNNTTNGATGLPTIAAGEDLTIFGNGGIIERSTATETPAFRLFDVAAGASLTLEDLTLQRGLALASSPNSPDWGHGGAILSQGTLTLRGATVQNNLARGGMVFAGIGFARGLNAAGGGIYSTGALTLENSVIENNQARAGNGTSAGHAVGGGLYVAGTADLTAVALIANSVTGGNALSPGRPGGRPMSGGPGGASFGGGIYVSGGTVSLDEVVLSANTAQGGNGGIGRNRRGGAGGSGFGGGICVASGAVTVNESSITENEANGGPGGSGRPAGKRGKGKGGGLYIADDALVCLDPFTKSHVKRNHASTAGNNIAGPYTVCR